MKNYFKVYRNGQNVGETSSASLKAAKTFIKVSLLSTHMGEWRRAVSGYRYHTTIGVTFDFVRFGRGAA